MTEPMRESSCGRCRALDLVVAEKDKEIGAYKLALDLKGVEHNQCHKDAEELAKLVLAKEERIKELREEVERWKKMERKAMVNILDETDKKISTLQSENESLKEEIEIQDTQRDKLVNLHLEEENKLEAENTQLKEEVKKLEKMAKEVCEDNDCWHKSQNTNLRLALRELKKEYGIEEKI